MSKIILALGLVAALSAPAAAGRLDVDLNAANGSAQIGEGANVDTFTTQSITTVRTDADGAGQDRKLFGADSR